MQELIGKGLQHEWGMDINGRGLWMFRGMEVNGEWELMGYGLIIGCGS